MSGTRRIRLLVAVGAAGFAARRRLARRKTDTPPPHAILPETTRTISPEGGTQ